MENSKKNGYLCDCLLSWQQSVIYSYERNWNPRCFANLHCECQELKPKVATNTSFLVLHPFSGVDTVKTVGSHLKLTIFSVQVKFLLRSYNAFINLLGKPNRDFGGIPNSLRSFWPAAGIESSGSNHFRHAP